MTEVNLALAPIQMGARVYLPTLGRFTSLDPVRGGTPNNYTYVLDPVNYADYTGMFGWHSITNWVKQNVKKIAVVVVVVTIAVVAVVLAPAEVVAAAGAAIGAAAAAIGRAGPAIARGASRAGPAISKGASVASKAVTTAAKAVPRVMPRADPSKINSLASTSYSSKVINQMANTADQFHSFPKQVDNFGSYGAVSKIVGNDGIQRLMLRIPGSLNGINGNFEYIIEPDGIINHRLFRPY
jgi:hypothetical protein